MPPHKRTEATTTRTPDQGRDAASMDPGNPKARETGPELGPGALERLKTDTHLAILCVFCVVASLAIVPFAVYRLLQGQIAVAVIDGLIVVAILGGFVYAWKTGRSTLAGNFIATLVASGAMVVILALGLSYVWLFSLMIAIFLMASNRVGIVLSMVLIGVVGSTPGAFSDTTDQVTFLAVAIQVAVFAFVFAWRTSRQHRQLDVLANRDPLTGLGNRRALRRELAARMQAARIAGEPAALAVIDLDNFKDVNDRHGHDAGDQVLVDLAEIVGVTMRSSDSFYRFGGEEFVLVMGGTSQAGLAPALDKLQAGIRERLRGPDGPVTISIGAAELGADEDAGHWLTRADRALYAAKNAGRNRALVAGE